ncbi:MAG: septal ring lytic transglycosylase RlpA family protein [Hyphomicrobiaceae bacterium]
MTAFIRKFKSNAPLAIFLAMASPVAAQDGSLFGNDDGPARGAPASPRSWRVTIQRSAHDREPVAAADPRWTATVTYSKVPLLAANPIPRAAPRPVNPATGKSHTLEGIASYYWQDQTTASGERFDKTALTAAHKTLPLQARVRVTNVINGRSIVVRINDRGPFKPGRVIDLSEAAAHHLDMQRLGLVPVKIQVISQ